MHLTIAEVLPRAELDELIIAMSNARFTDGRATAGWSAALVKNNEQVETDLAVERLVSRAAMKLRTHPVFQISAYPKSIIRSVVSRYGPGMAYGTHVDDAIMDGERTDLAFTLFLSDPEGYDGGELVIETPAGDDAIKLPAGSAYVYPATTLHHVAAVTRGERLALVGWVRSYVRDPAKRELLFDLETVRRTMFETGGKTSAFDQLSKCSANLLRLWIDD